MTTGEIVICILNRFKTNHCKITFLALFVQGANTHVMAGMAVTWNHML